MPKGAERVDSNIEIKPTTLAFWAVFILTLVISTTAAVTNNRNGYYENRHCVLSTGGREPECEQYGTEIVQESRVRTALRGVGDGLVFAPFLGFGAMFPASWYAERREKRYQNDKASDR